MLNEVFGSEFKVMATSCSHHVAITDVALTDVAYISDVDLTEL